MIFVNYKTFEEGSGQKAIFLTRILETVSREMHIKIIPAVQLVDLKEIASFSSLEIWVQKIDPFEYGAHTGAVIADTVFEKGAAGTFLNHSESRFLNFDDLIQALNRAKKVGLKTLIFTRDLDELKKVCSLSPNFVAYEPPELIGSTTTSVALAKPEIVSQACKIARDFGIPLIVGAGVHSRDDVKESLRLGAVGVAVATDIVKAFDPERELKDLTEGFK